jgi:isocitrate dehydrogenase (NAD+)
VTPQLRDGKTTIPAETIKSIEKNKVALKGPLAVSHSFSLGNGGI